MAETADINVDELRRRARRRLVGAIVLALAAAVIVPMLLESDPKPLGQDVTIRIPPVDDGKFVNRLNEPDARDAAATVAGSAPAGDAAAAKDAAGGRDAAPAPPAADTEKVAAASAPRPSKYDTALPPDKAPPAAPAATVPAAQAPPPKAEAKAAPPKPEPRAQAPSAPAAPVQSAPTPPAVPAAAKADAARDGYAVQLAAFSDDKGANALANRLKTAGYPAYTEPFATSRGTLWRVRVGPYPSRDAAGGVRDKLKSEGQNGIVAPAH